MLWTRDEQVRELSGYGPGSVGVDYGGPMVAAVYLMRSDGAALLQLRDQKAGLRHAGAWVPPGGHSDPGETLVQAARREFEEETRVSCTSLRWCNAFEVVLPPWPTFLLGSFWDYYDGAQAYECLEGQALEFVEREAATELPMPAFVVRNWDHVLTQM